MRSVGAGLGCCPDATMMEQRCRPCNAGADRHAVSGRQETQCRMGRALNWTLRVRLERRAPHTDLSSVTSLLPFTQLSVSLTVVIENVVIGKVVITIVDNNSVDSHRSGHPRRPDRHRTEPLRGTSRRARRRNSRPHRGCPRRARPRRLPDSPTTAMCSIAVAARLVDRPVRTRTRAVRSSCPRHGGGPSMTPPARTVRRFNPGTVPLS